MSLFFFNNIFNIFQVFTLAIFILQFFNYIIDLTKNTVVSIRIFYILYHFIFFCKNFNYISLLVQLNHHNPQKVPYILQIYYSPVTSINLSLKILKLSIFICPTSIILLFIFSHRSS